MANPRNTIPPETISVERQFGMYPQLLTLGSIETGISRIVNTLKAEKITILTDVQTTGSVLVQKSLEHSSSGSWQTIGTIADSGMGSLILSPDTIGVIPELRVIGSSLGAGSVLVDLYFRAYN